MLNLFVNLVLSVPSCGTLSCPLAAPLVQDLFSNVFKAIHAKPLCCKAAILGAICLAKIKENTQAALKSLVARLDNLNNVRI